MDKLPFVLWMLGWPALEIFERILIRREMASEAVGWWIVIWVIGGILSYPW